MRITTTCLTIMLTCSCCHTTDDTHPGSTKEAMTRHDEVRKAMRSYWIHSYETANDMYWSSAAERRKILTELRKMKKDYHYELNDRNFPLTVPGPGWGIRGPLTIAQVEQESLEETTKSPHVPQVPFGYANDKWNKLKSQYKDGDEFYFFAADSRRYFQGTAGYVLIRDNELVDLIVTGIS